MSVEVRSRRGGRAEWWLDFLFGTTPAVVAIDAAAVVARVVLAWVFIYYGAAKLFGWFGKAGPHGIHDSAQFFSQTAHLHPGGFFAVFGGLIELGGGIAMALGLLSRLAGLALLGDMVMAMITVTWTTGINSVTSPPGYQVNIALAALALMITLMGAGRFSLDAVIGRQLQLGELPDRGPG